MQPKVSIIILNWNGWRDTLECLEHLYHIKYQNFNVIVVDNDSKDDSIRKIKDYCEDKVRVKSKFYDYTSINKPITVFEYTKDQVNNIDRNIFGKLRSDRKLFLIKNDINSGFADGNNLGIRFIQNNLETDYILLLNNDTVVDSSFLNELIKVAEKNCKVGVLGPKIYYYDFEGRSDVIWSLGGIIDWSKFPGYFELTKLPSKIHNDAVIKCDYISGAAMLLKFKDVPIKKLNNKFIFGCEDVDLCLRLKSYDFEIITVLKSKIWHKGGSSRNKKDSIAIKRYIPGVLYNLKFMRIHNKYFYFYLPLYLPQIVNDLQKKIRISKKKIKSELN
jgi:GT2 family glycosyltransferase